VRYRKPRSSYRQQRLLQPRRQPNIRRRVRRPIIRRGRALTRFRIWLATGDRVKYRVAGKAYRQAAAVSAKVSTKRELSVFDHRVLEAVTVFLTSFSRVNEWRTLTHLAAFVYQIHVKTVAGWHRKDVGKSLKRLRNAGVITYTPGRGRGSYGTIGFVPAEEGVPDVLEELGITNPDDLNKEREGDGTPPFPPEKGRVSDEKREGVTAEKGGYRGRHSEKARARKQERGFGEVSEPDSERDSSGGSFTPKRADEERNEDESWCADAPADVRPFWVIVASHTRGNVKLQPDGSLGGAVRDAMKRSGQSARALAGSLEPGKWPATFNKSAEAYAAWRLGQVGRAP
jgi:hypothetical protein